MKIFSWIMLDLPVAPRLQFSPSGKQRHRLSERSTWSLRCLPTRLAGPWQAGHLSLCTHLPTKKKNMKHCYTKEWATNFEGTVEIFWNSPIAGNVLMAHRNRGSNMAALFGFKKSQGSWSSRLHRAKDGTLFMRSILIFHIFFHFCSVFRSLFPPFFSFPFPFPFPFLFCSQCRGQKQRLCRLKRRPQSSAHRKKEWAELRAERNHHRTGRLQGKKHGSWCFLYPGDKVQVPRYGTTFVKFSSLCGKKNARQAHTYRKWGVAHSDGTQLCPIGEDDAKMKARPY